MKILNVEPAMVIGLVTAVLVLLVAFGVPLTTEQSEAIVGVTSAVLVVLGAVLTRSKVTPDVKVAAYEDGAGQTLSGPADTAVPNGTPVKVRTDVSAL